MSIFDLFKGMADGIQNGGAEGVSSSPLIQRVSSAYGQPQADPSAADPYAADPYAPPQADPMQGVRNMSSMLIAMGQPMSGSDRAQIIAKMSENNNPTKDAYNAAQARLMNTQYEDALDKRKTRQAGLSALKGMDLGDDFSDKEKAIFNSFLAAGDVDGANGFLADLQKATGRNATVLANDGQTLTTKGLMNADANAWKTTYLPKSEGAAGKLAITSDMLDLMDAGTTAGSLSDWKVLAAKLRHMGSNAPIDPAALNREKFNALAVDLTLQRMKMLGGNDTEKEYDNMSKAVAGINSEPETVRNNLQTTIKRTIQDATIADQQRLRIGTPAFGTAVNFSPDIIADQYKPYWQRAVGTEKADGTGYNNKGGGDKDGNGQVIQSPVPNVSFKHLWGGK
jgi:negative regulator of replication initiation